MDIYENFLKDKLRIHISVENEKYFKNFMEEFPGITIYRNQEVWETIHNIINILGEVYIYYLRNNRLGYSFHKSPNIKSIEIDEFIRKIKPPSVDDSELMDILKG